MIDKLANRRLPTGEPGMRSIALIGTAFVPALPARYWGNRAFVDCVFTCFIDGEEVGSRAQPVEGPFGDYGLTPVGSFTVTEPGVHEIAIDARLIGGAVENDAENNRKSRSVVYVEAGN